MISESRKAIAAFIVAFLTPVGTMLASGQPLDWRVWAASVVAGLIAAFTTWIVPNRQP